VEPRLLVEAKTTKLRLVAMPALLMMIAVLLLRRELLLGQELLLRLSKTVFIPPKVLQLLLPSLVLCIVSLLLHIIVEAGAMIHLRLLLAGRKSHRS
jgi:hypothetical protein